MCIRDRQFIEDLLRRLADLGSPKVVLTGVSFEEGRLGAAAYDADQNAFSYSFCDRVDGYFHGTGDVFGSALLAATMSGKTLNEAVQIAVDYTHRCICLTVEAGQELRYGVCFERALPYLIQRLGLDK